MSAAAEEQTVLLIIPLVSGCRWEIWQLRVAYFPDSRNQTSAVTWLSHWSSTFLPWFSVLISDLPYCIIWVKEGHFSRAGEISSPASRSHKKQITCHSYVVLFIVAWSLARLKKLLILLFTRAVSTLFNKQWEHNKHYKPSPSQILHVVNKHERPDSSKVFYMDVRTEHNSHSWNGSQAVFCSKLEIWYFTSEPFSREYNFCRYM